MPPRPMGPQRFPSPYGYPMMPGMMPSPRPSPYLALPQPSPMALTAPPPVHRMPPSVHSMPPSHQPSPMEQGVGGRPVSMVEPIPRGHRNGSTPGANNPSLSSSIGRFPDEEFESQSVSCEIEDITDVDLDGDSGRNETRRILPKGKARDSKKPTSEKKGVKQVKKNDKKKKDLAGKDRVFTDDENEYEVADGAAATATDKTTLPASKSAKKHKA